MVPGNHEYDSARSCENLQPVPVRIEVRMLESEAFKVMHRNMMDRSPAEREVKDRVARMFRSHISRHPGLKVQDDAPNTVVITVRLIDTIEDKYQSGASDLAILLSCATLLIYPGYTETEEHVGVSLFQGNTLVAENRYTFYRVSYMGWSMIPFNFFYTPSSPSWGVTASSVDYDQALAPLKPAVDAELKDALCKMGSQPIPSNGGSIQ
ncbi:MAG: hypothetical protein CMN77_08990 [Spirochaetaceae bacterium]|nr:hypothetical protein [Spirochaetaceae bacterium]